MRMRSKSTNSPEPQKRGAATADEARSARQGGVPRQLPPSTEPLNGTARAHAADEELDDLEAGDQAAPETATTDDGQSPDDALGLYLRQMGAIPLLSRQEE